MERNELAMRLDLLCAELQRQHNDGRAPWADSHDLDALLEAAAALRDARDGWQPMKTAPKSLKVLVGYRNSHGHWRNVTAIYYPDGALPTEETTDGGEEEFAPTGWYETSETHKHIHLTNHPPTAWQPLPPPPKAAPSDQENGK